MYTISIYYIFYFNFDLQCNSFSISVICRMNEHSTKCPFSKIKITITRLTAKHIV